MPVSQEALQQRVAELERAQAELQAFSTAVAHDLRSPLSAMNSYCSLLEDSLAALPPQPALADCHKYLGRLRAGLVQMSELIDGLQRLSRASSVALRRETLDITALALEVIDSLKTCDPGRPCQCSVQSGLQARGDRALVRQLLENLLGNAWKFSAGQPHIRIEVGREPGANGAFFVRDHGAGFDMARADRLFQPFERLHSESQFPGTGIGLATVRRIVARHGGQVRATSRPGEGATFFFTLAA